MTQKILMMMIAFWMIPFSYLSLITTSLLVSFIKEIIQIKNFMVEFFMIFYSF